MTCVQCGHMYVAFSIGMGVILKGKVIQWETVWFTQQLQPVPVTTAPSPIKKGTTLRRILTKEYFAI